MKKMRGGSVLNAIGSMILLRGIPRTGCLRVRHGRKFLTAGVVLNARSSSARKVFLSGFLIEEIIVEPLGVVLFWLRPGVPGDNLVCSGIDKFQSDGIPGVEHPFFVFD